MQYTIKLKGQTGVTLIELMIVIVITGILAALVAPSFNGFVNRTKQSSMAAQVVSDLNRARSEAIKRNMRVLFCARSSDSTCGAGTDLQSGWLVCRDADSNNDCDAGTATDPNPIVIHRAVDSNLTLNLTTGTAPLRFNASGISGNGAATLTLGGTWSGASNKLINIAATGSISRP